MYLHIGADYIVRKQAVIGIFDLDNTSVSKDTRNFLYGAEKNRKTVNVSAQDLPKSFIVTEDRIYISPLSSQTIKRRAKQ